MPIYQRRLPHRYIIGLPLFITYRLHDSLPPGRVFADTRLMSGRAFAFMDRMLDESRSSPLYLRMPEIAQLVVDSIRSGCKGEYSLHAWVVMPNHVHLLITPVADVSGILRRLKGATARQANKVLRREGRPFWQRESYDRLIRDSQEFGRIERYIIRNPVRAGLAARAEEFRWSSAWDPNGGLKPAAS